MTSKKNRATGSMKKVGAVAVIYRKGELVSVQGDEIRAGLYIGVNGKFYQGKEVVLVPCSVSFRLPVTKKK